MTWTRIHRAFVVEEFLKIEQSVTRPLKSFERPFNLKRHDPVPSYKCNALGAAIQSNQFCIKPKISGKSRSARTPDNVKRVKGQLCDLPLVRLVSMLRH